MTYVNGLARHSFHIDREIRGGGWPKPPGISLADRVVALVGFGDIGRQTARRLLAADMLINVYDPFFVPVDGLSVIPLNWPDGLEKARSEEHTSELQSLMRTSYAVFCLKKKTKTKRNQQSTHL